jgi:hypothetical protein
VITCAVEKLATARLAIEELLPAQWAETGDPEFQYRPNWTLYQQLETAGALVLIVMRDAGVPVGYIGAAVHPHINATHILVASIPTWYVAVGAARGLRVHILIREMWKLLRDRGCLRATVDTEFNHSAGRLLELMGGKPVKIGYSFDLEKIDA